MTTDHAAGVVATGAIAQGAVTTIAVATSRVAVIGHVAGMTEETEATGVKNFKIATAGARKL